MSSTQLIKVIIVDDELAIRAGLRNLIHWEQEGFVVVGEAPNGKEALKLISEFSPSIVITDLVMPVLDGLELSSIIGANYPDIRSIVLSSFDDFEMVKSSFQNGVTDYILKPTLTPESLLKTLRKVASLLDLKEDGSGAHANVARDLSNYLSGYSTELDVKELAESLAPATQYVYLYTNLSYYKSPQAMDTQFKQYNTLIAEQVSCLPFITSQNDVGLLIGMQGDFDMLLEFLKSKFGSIDFIDPDVFFTLSKPFADLNLLKDYYTEFKRMSENQRFFFKGSKIVKYENLIQFENDDKFDTNQYLLKLINRDFADGLSQIDSYFNELLMNAASPRYLNEQASSIFYTLFTMMENKGSFDENFGALRMNFITKLNSCNYIDDFASLILDMIAKLELLINTGGKEDELLQQILSYINKNYNQGITLTSISKQFHFSSNYLSSFFSSKYNVTFSDYLNQIRIGKAKELLQNTEMNLSEICYEVGYNDPAYFSKMFKKLTGLSPSKFRRGEY
ncbi:MAG: response regulator [Clostridiales Family XIII bacterium]|nr:response regulator [Clostridiales Family XIII bacterium]